MPLPREKVLKNWRVVLYPKPKTYIVLAQTGMDAVGIARQNWEGDPHYNEEFYRWDLTDMEEEDKYPPKKKL